ALAASEIPSGPKPWPASSQPAKPWLASETGRPAGDQIPDPGREIRDRQASKVLAGPAPDRHGARFLLPGAHHQHVRHLLELGLADLVVQALVPGVELDAHTALGELGRDLRAVLVELLRHRQHHGLLRREPERE